MVRAERIFIGERVMILTMVSDARMILWMDTEVYYSLDLVHHDGS